MKRCSATKRDGTPCSLPSVGADGFCWAHTPKNAEKRKAGQKKGGRSKPLSDVAVLQRKLSDLGDDVLAGRVDRGKASVAAQCWGVAIKALEAWVKMRELEEARLVETQLRVEEQRELVARLEQLEASLDRGQEVAW